MLTHNEINSSDKIHMIQDKIEKITIIEKQLKKRYGINYSGLLLYSEEHIDIEVCRGFVRESDIIRPLFSNLILIIYRVVDDTGAMKATENLVNAYQNMHPPQDMYIALSSQDEKISMVDVEHALTQLLRYSVNEKKLNSIITMYDII